MGDTEIIGDYIMYLLTLPIERVAVVITPYSDSLGLVLEDGKIFNLSIAQGTALSFVAEMFPDAPTTLLDTTKPNAQVTWIANEPTGDTQ